MSLYSRRMLINIQQCICYQSIYSRFSVHGICCSNIDLEPESMEIIMLKENFIKSYQLSTKYFGTYLSDQCYVYLVQEMESYGWGPWALSDFIRINYNCANYM